MRDPARVLARLERLATFLDAAIVIPGTSRRIGFDALIGLIPGIGDALSGLIAATIVIEAIRLGAPAALIVRMIANILIDTGLGSVPLAGDVFDALFQSNRRNVALLRAHLAQTGVIAKAR